MSEMRANKLSSADGLKPTELHKQIAAKSYVCLDMINANLRGAFNISSVEDFGVGTWRANVVSAMLNTNYATTSSTYADSYDMNAVCWSISPTQYWVRGIKSVAGTYADGLEINAAIHGGLA